MSKNISMLFPYFSYIYVPCMLMTKCHKGRRVQGQEETRAGGHKGEIGGHKDERVQG